jgi:hypothetical protein
LTGRTLALVSLLRIPVMSYLAILVISFLATLSLASPVARQTSLCPSNGTPNASNFTLLAVSKTDPSVQTPLALGSNGLTDDSTSYLGVFPPFLPPSIALLGFYLECRLPTLSSR